MKKILSNFLIAFILLLINGKFFYLNGLKNDSLFLVLYEITVYYVIFFFIVHLFRFSKILTRIWVLFLMFLSFFGVYYIDTMGIVIDKQIMKNIFATTQGEVFELLKSTFFIYLFIVIGFLSALYYFIISKMERLSWKNYVSIFIITIIIFLGLTKINDLFYKDFIKNDTQSVVPLNIIRAYANYIRTKDRESTITKKNISDQFVHSNDSTKPLIAVVVIGESARGDRFALNGYKKDTTPLLSQEKNLISFKNATSCDTSTISSVPCMLLEQKQGEFSFPIRENSFVKVARDHGFDTYWITMQTEAPSIHTFCEEAAHCIQYDWQKVKYDTAMIEKFKNIVQNIKTNTLIVLHMMGSHIEYNNRVPNNMKIFQPICEKQNDQCRRATLDNSYDNTIYFTDYFLTQLIDILKNKNSFLLFSSDHGESLGEKQYGLFERYGHASPLNVAPIEQIHVPFIFWTSKEFLKYYSIQTFQKVSHDNIFSTVLGCSGFQSKLIDQKLNLCKKKE